MSSAQMTFRKLFWGPGRLEAVAGEEGHEVGAAAQSELLVGPADMGVERGRAEAEGLGRLLLRRPARERGDRFRLAARQPQPVAQ